MLIPITINWVGAPDEPYDEILLPIMQDQKVNLLLPELNWRMYGLPEINRYGIYGNVTDLEQAWSIYALANGILAKKFNNLTCNAEVGSNDALAVAASYERVIRESIRKLKKIRSKEVRAVQRLLESPPWIKPVSH